MKTLLILTEKCLSGISLSSLRESSDNLRIILAVSERLYDTFQDADGFDAVFYIQETLDSNEIFKVLDLGRLEAIVGSEIKLLVDRSANKNDMFIYCADEANVLIAAQLRKKFSLSGAHHENVLHFRDKLLMKRTASRFKINIPIFFELDVDELFNNEKKYYLNLKYLLDGKFVLKPTDSAGSFGIFIINSYQDFKCFSLRFKTLSEAFKVKYIVEEFISGKLFHIDTVTCEKKIIFSEASEYLYPNFDFQNGKILSSIRLPEDNSVKNRLIKFVEKLLIAFGLPEGAQHTEVFISRKTQDIVFLETSARPPGMFVNQMYQKSTGVSIPMLEIVSQLQLNIKIGNNVQNLMPTFWAVLPKPAGVVTELVPPKLPSHFDIEWFVFLGEKIHATRSNLDFSAKIMVADIDELSLRKSFELLRNFRGIFVK